MRARWESLKLWVSQYRVELRRGFVASLISFGAFATDRDLLGWLVLAGTAVMFLTMMLGARYQTLGQAMMSGNARRIKRSPETEGSSENTGSDSGQL